MRTYKKQGSAGLVTVVVALLITSILYAADIQGPGSLLYRGTYIQGWSPNGLYTANLTSSTTHDLTNFLAWAVYCVSDCQGRAMPTSNKGSYPQFTIPGGSWYVEVKNSDTPFINISGAHQWKQQ